MTLDELGIKHGTDKASQHPHAGHGYLTHYEKFFKPLRHKPIKLLEIGVGGGESIRLWLEYFPAAKVWGLDINPESWNGEDERYRFVVGDQESRAFWDEFFVNHGCDFNVVIDDGGHFSGQIIASFESIWHRLPKGALYCVEDLGTCYSPGSVFNSNGLRAIDFCKSKVDDLNQGSDIEWSYFTRELCIMQKKHV